MDKLQLIKKLRKEGFSNKIIQAFSKVKRDDFISSELKKYAYEDEPLPIERGATISQPYTIAFMLELLELNKLKSNSDTNHSNTNTPDTNKPCINKPKILEIGSGSGYVLALINEISPNSEILGIEILKELANNSKRILKNKKNINIIQGNGNKPRNEKFDRILISASADKIPEHFINALNNLGILVCVVRNSIFQIQKIGNKLKTKEFPGFVFVRLTNN